MFLLALALTAPAAHVQKERKCWVAVLYWSVNEATSEHLSIWATHFIRTYVMVTWGKLFTPRPLWLHFSQVCRISLSWISIASAWESLFFPSLWALWKPRAILNHTNGRLWMFASMIASVSECMSECLYASQAGWGSVFWQYQVYSLSSPPPSTLSQSHAFLIWKQSGDKERENDCWIIKYNLSLSKAQVPCPALIINNLSQVSVSHIWLMHAIINSSEPR